MGRRIDGPDQGIFDIPNLFIKAIRGHSFLELGQQDKAELLSRFEHKVSSRIPIWVRLPLAE